MNSLTEIHERWSKSPERIYDDELREALGNAKSALDEYWGALVSHMDGPYHIRNNWYDLEVIKPPGGPWGPDHEKYYDFVRHVASLRQTLLAALHEVDRRLYDLRVESDVLPS